MILKELLEKIKSGELETDLSNAQADLGKAIAGHLDYADLKTQKLLELVRLFRDVVPELKGVVNKVGNLLSFFK